MGWVVAVIIALFIFDLIIHAIAVRVALPIFESKPPFRADLWQAPDGSESFIVPTTNDLHLQAAYIHAKQQPARGLILFCPEFGSNRYSAQWYCDGLVEAGFDVFAIDFRNQADSEHQPGYEPLHWLSEFEVQDVLSAIDFIQQHPRMRSLPLGIFGISRGAGAAIVAASRRECVRCIVSDGAYSASSLLYYYAKRFGPLYLPDWFLRFVPRWHFTVSLRVVEWVSQWRKNCVYSDLERALKRLVPRPLFMISGSRDNYVHPEITQYLFELTHQPADRMWIVPDAKHNLARQQNPEEYDRRVTGFFAQLAPLRAVPATVAIAAATLHSAPHLTAPSPPLTVAPHDTSREIPARDVASRETPAAREVVAPPTHTAAKGTHAKSPASSSPATTGHVA